MYKEAEARQEFIDPLLEALGWDVGNRAGVAPAHREVVVEYSMKIGSYTKAPDYLVRLDGKPRFFVEAKKPQVNVKEDIGPAFQVRRYAWTAQLPLSILTDFDELAVYDTRVEPKKGDAASVARLLYIPHGELVDRWDEVAALFGRNAVLAGSLERFAQETRAPRGATTVDAAFLREIERWRELLARNIAAHNDALSQRQLNYAVQMTIDRLIFLRICEDRAIEPYGALLGEINGARVYPRLLERFRDADARYNSGLFHFASEKGREDADTLTPVLDIPDEPLRTIIGAMYFPESPYEFSVMPVEILGQVYEQFLGKVIRLEHGNAVVEEKPEVRKAGGVYYTPAYIVAYIVRQTVGRLLEGKTPKTAAALRIVDPACGSGSFLLGAYQLLLDWHRDGYVAEGPQKHKKELYQSADGEWRLTTSERRRILLNNLYGVDIDAQAVEVTKLSLCLKMLEGETEQTMGQLRFFRERVLPDLGNNIKCGNALIGPDFYHTDQLSFLDEEIQYRINAFDWHAEFAPIFAAGGFDAVIGNPPYIRIQTMKEWAPIEVEEYKLRYHAASKGNYDIYVVFVERGLQLLNLNGRLGYILPHKFFNAQYGAPLRGLIAAGQHLSDIVHFGHQQIFTGATTYTCLLFLSKAGQSIFSFVKIENTSAWSASDIVPIFELDAGQVTSREWTFVGGGAADTFQRLASAFRKLGDVADIFVGLQTSADDVFIMRYQGMVDEGQLNLYSESLSREVVIDNNLVFPVVSGTDVRRYQLLPYRQYIIFPYTVSNEKAQLIEDEKLKLNSYSTFIYLEENRSRLEQRERGKFADQFWYRFGRNQNLGIQSRAKICVPRLVDVLHATLDADGSHFLDNVDVGGVTWRAEYARHGLVYLLGLINSRLLAWFFPFVSAPFRGGYMSANKQFLSQLPIRIIDFDNPADVVQHDRMVALVERMLDLHRRQGAAATPQERSVIQRQIAATDAEIDALVYALYGLSAAEIAVVEGRA